MAEGEGGEKRFGQDVKGWGAESRPLGGGRGGPSVDRHTHECCWCSSRLLHQMGRDCDHQ